MKLFVVPRFTNALLIIAIIASLLQCVDGKTGSLSKEGRLAVIIVAAALVVGVIITLAVVFICKRKCRTKHQHYQAVAFRPVHRVGAHGHKESWEIPLSSLIISNEVIAEGLFGDILKTKMKRGLKRTTVAVTILEVNALTSVRDVFHTELDLLRKIGRHPNIISIVGISHSRDTLYVAFDFAANGDLRSFLRKHRLPSGNNNISSISPLRLLRFANDVAKGMDYLSSIDIVHKCLAAKNVLIGNGLVAKISGLGLSKQQPSKTSMRKYSRHISFRWSAIESWSQQVFTTKSDVWSFGILLWEIVTLGGTPYHASRDSNLLQQRLADGHRLGKPYNCTDEMYKIMMLCWQDSADDRPSFSDLLLDLHRMLEAKTISDQMFTTFKQQDGYTHAIIDPEQEDM